MGLILNLETTTKNCSVSLAEYGQLLAVREINEQGYSHAEKLQPFIDEVLSQSGRDLKDLAAVAISQGPGSYTGLRIGTSLAKGLCYALEIPLISTNTLQAQAIQLKLVQGVIVSVIDARRMEVYQAVFDSNYKEVSPVESHVVDANSYDQWLKKGQVYFIGDATEKIKTLIHHPRAIFCYNHWPSAIQMAELSFEKYRIKEFVDLAYFEPFYLKDFVNINPPK
jgi:tRNA threonylcarbamoyladenosine biosynthesis protein TsaB